jgi:hypothetical protein
MKNDGRLEWNYLRGIEGDRTNAMLCAVGQNLRLPLRFIVGFFRRFVENRHFCRSISTFSHFSPARAA